MYVHTECAVHRRSATVATYYGILWERMNVDWVEWIVVGLLFVDFEASHAFEMGHEESFCIVQQ